MWLFELVGDVSFVMRIPMRRTMLNKSKIIFKSFCCWSSLVVFLFSSRKYIHKYVTKYIVLTNCVTIISYKMVKQLITICIYYRYYKYVAIVAYMQLYNEYGTQLYIYEIQIYISSSINIIYRVKNMIILI